MRITSAQIQKIYELRLQKTGKTEGSAAPDASGGPDELVFSRKALALQKARQAISGLPVIRQALVEELKQKIESGEYKVASDDLAERIFGMTNEE